jgi:hypothetical protein
MGWLELLKIGVLWGLRCLHSATRSTPSSQDYTVVTTAVPPSASRYDMREDRFNIRGPVEPWQREEARRREMHAQPA